MNVLCIAQQLTRLTICCLPTAIVMGLNESELKILCSFIHVNLGILRFCISIRLFSLIV
jgi:hypothetical protein